MSGERPLFVSRGLDGVRSDDTLRCAARLGVRRQEVRAKSPARPKIPRAIIATPYDRFPEARSETRIVPAIAVPKDEPRLEMLRERPEISPCRFSGKLDCTTFTDGVSITPSPRPISSRPGPKAITRSEDVGTQPEEEPDPGRA